jgi:hypothetical protein
MASKDRNMRPTLPRAGVRPSSGAASHLTLQTPMSAQSLPPNGALVHVDNVEKVFHRGAEEIHVLRDLNLTVPAGEFPECARPRAQQAANPA